jgi:hypothetical protein
MSTPVLRLASTWWRNMKMSHKGLTPSDQFDDATAAESDQFHRAVQRWAATRFNALAPGDLISALQHHPG